MPRTGTRKLYYLLKNEFVSLGVKIGRDALFDYLRSEQMSVKPKKRYTQTTTSKHWLRQYSNMVKDLKFSIAEQLSVSDITSIKSRQKIYYLSLVTDAYSRKIMGYLSEDMIAESIVKALRMAIKKRKTTGTLIHHSDRGLQYCSDIYQTELTNNQVDPAMTDEFDCYQNALAEGVNGILKQKFVVDKCHTKEEFDSLIKQSVEIITTKDRS